MTRLPSALLLGTILLGCVAARPLDAAGSRPNILFILSDDHRPDGIAALGNPQLKTPTLDRMVERGTCFRNAYVMGSMEGAVCAPSRCMIQTGRSLFHLPKVNFRKGYAEFAAAMTGKTEGRDWSLLPRLLRANGYSTFHVGKGGNECVPALQSYDENVIRDDRAPEERIHSSEAHADRVIEHLRGRKKDKPFFIYLAPPVPHDPRMAPKEFMDMYDPARIPLPASFLPIHPFDNGEMTVRDEQLAPWPRTREVIRRHLADYYACITCLDQHLGRVFTCLKELGQLDNTVIIFAGDNGLSLGDHGLMGKQNLYEFGGMHVPLVIAGPGIARGGSDAFVYLYDLFPTICELAGAAVPASADGKSLVSLLSGKATRVRDSAFTAYKDVQRAVRDNRWKLIRYPQIDKTQLFDLQTDPHELNDLAGEPDQAAKTAQMLLLLEQAQKEYGDACPLTVAAPRPVAWSPPEKQQKQPADAESAKSAGQPNIILILTDDQGYGDLSCHGNPVLKTPNLDRLHDEGRRLTDFHVSPTCSPTRCALMTGRHEFRSGVTHTIQERERMSLKATTIAQVLRSAGYATGIFGKWHLGDEPERWPDKRGFEEMFIHGAGGIGQTFPGSCGDAPGNTYFDPVILHNGKFEKAKGYCTDVFFGQALKWIEMQKRGKPFFAYIAPNAPHAPLDVPPEYEKLYAGKAPSNVAKFFGMIANIDDNAGRLLAKLKAWDIERDTLVIFMNDNGGTAGLRIHNAGMRGGKVTPYNGGTRAASFWRWPGTLSPGDVDKLTAHIDVFPTLAELAGARIPDAVAAKLDGHSLVPLLRDANAPWPERYLFAHVGRWDKGKAADSKYRQCSVRSPGYDLVCSTKDGSRKWELYDLKTDPGETKNIAEEHRDIVRPMEAAYDQWWDKVFPRLENESAVGPSINPFKELYWKQFGGEPDEASRRNQEPAGLRKGN